MSVDRCLLLSCVTEATRDLCPHCEKFILYVKRKIYFQFLDIWFECGRQMCRQLKNQICTLSFFVNLAQVEWPIQK